MEPSRLARLLDSLTADGKLSSWEALAIYRCCKYSDQIADVSIGNAYRADIAALLEAN